MSEISILGLGLMGGSLARTLQTAGHETTVWNRSPEKMKPFVERGAEGAPNVAAAIETSPVILVCVDNYAVTRNLFEVEKVRSSLSGRIVIQLSTGTPEEAAYASNWFDHEGVGYLDGAILALPGHIGTDDAQILLAGSGSAFRRAEPLLRCLAGNLRYLGENVRAPAALDLAWLSQRFGMILGAIHGLNLCDSEGVSAGQYAQLFPEGCRVRVVAEMVDTGNYGKQNVTVNVWQAVVERLRRQAQLAGINGAFPEFAAGVIERATKLGYGDADIAALIETLREA